MITLALPAYNEQDNIVKVLEETTSFMKTLNTDWEVLVIDNASNDQTAQRVQDFSKTCPQVRLISHETNRLYSGSCATALREGKGERIAIMDSDRQHTAKDLPKFLAKIDEGAGLVIGWRRHRNDPFLRKVFSGVFNTMGKLYLSYPLNDLNCGFRVMDKKFAKSISINHRINLSNPELYTRAVIAGVPVAEVEVNHFKREEGKSTMNFGKSFQLFVTVNNYFKSLSEELRSRKQA